MPNDGLDAGHDVHSFQSYPWVSFREDSENLVSKPLPDRFHPRKVENDFAELIEPGEEPSGLRSGDIFPGVESYRHKASFELEIELLRRER